MYTTAWNELAPIAHGQIIGDACAQIPQGRRISQELMLQRLVTGSLLVSHSSKNSPLEVCMTFPGQEDTLPVMPFWVREIDPWHRHYIPEPIITDLGRLDEAVKEVGDCRVLTSLHAEAVALGALRQPRLNYLQQQTGRIDRTA